MKILFLFIDGLGLGPVDPAINPVNAGVCPHLTALLAEHSRPVDARLGVPGLPQSATGQTAIFTGVNAAQLLGRHVEGFPNTTLRDVIRRDNLYRKLADCSRRSTFANAYFTDDMEQVRTFRLQSVTTVAAMSALGEVRGRSLMEQNRAVYHDLTRELLLPRGYPGPLVTPAESAAHLAAIAGEYDLTVFEYFLTDHAGHSGDMPRAVAVLQRFDAFLGVLQPLLAQAGITLVLTSDHGNIEDMSVLTHTLNPVPFAVFGPGAAAMMARVTTLTDITAAILAAFAE